MATWERLESFALKDERRGHFWLKLRERGEKWCPKVLERGGTRVKTPIWGPFAFGVHDGFPFHVWGQCATLARLVDGRGLGTGPQVTFEIRSVAQLPESGGHAIPSDSWSPSIISMALRVLGQSKDE